MKHRLCAALAFSASSLLAQQADPVFVPEAVNPPPSRPAPRLAERAAREPIATLAAAAEAAAEEVEAVRRWNAEGRLPARNGFTRALPAAMAVRIPAGDPAVASAGMIEAQEAPRTWTWSGSVRVTGAYRFRLHLRDVVVPAGTTFWIYGAGETPATFGPELVDADGHLYTPSVGGETAWLEVEVPQDAGPAAFELADVLEIVPMGGGVSQNDSPSCLIDASCVSASSFDSISWFPRTIAHLQFVEAGAGYVCSGGLINDKDETTYVPYLLTANHCFSSQSSATSLEAFWEYKTSFCGGPFPSLSSLPRSNGSTLLKTSSQSDFTFVRLNSVPSGRWYAGWNANTSAVSSGTRLYRLSHPFPGSYSTIAPQFYSTAKVSTTAPACSSIPRPRFLYSKGVDGGTYGGSSGSPVVIAGGYIVGQLYGACGTNVSAGCDNTNNATVDGAFSTTFSSISSYINTVVKANQCAANATTACALGSRFRVQVRYRGQFDNLAADTDAKVKSVTGFGTASYETVFFYFNDPNNIEMMVKFLDQGNVDGSGNRTIAVLYGSATPLRLELTITDVTNGTVRKYTSPYGSHAGGTDFTAFRR